MKISTKGRYAVRILLDLAENQKDGYISLKSVAERQDISKGYLEQIISVLRNSVVVSANRGFQGGYRLAGAASEYSVGDILRLTEGAMAVVACLEKGVGGCARQPFCLTRPVWVGLTKAIADYLDSITLQNILDANRLPGGSSVRSGFKRKGC
ncbi:MAG: Rrf2 family transcriptional regulator [Desulfovibrio sp.]|jgi:Rrf2 family protein|nr:Rrf2 family transcriptional regulator [Desulfovibrio sp.]